MKISVITVCFNSESTIGDTIQSVASQTYKDVEHIIIDGASTDETLSIIYSLNKNVKLVSEKDYGIYDAMNKGIKMAKGDVIGILNSDDIYADVNVLTDIVNCFKENQEIDIVYGDLVYVKRNNTIKIIRKWKSQACDPYFFEKGNVPPHPTLFLKKQVYEAAGNFNLLYKLAADYELMLRVFKKYNFNSKYLPRLMIKMRLGGTTNQSLKNIIKGNMEILQAWKDNELRPPKSLMILRFFKRVKQFFP